MSSGKHLTSPSRLAVRMDTLRWGSIRGRVDTAALSLHWNKPYVSIRLDDESHCQDIAGPLFSFKGAWNALRSMAILSS